MVIEVAMAMHEINHLVVQEMTSRSTKEEEEQALAFPHMGLKKAFSDNSIEISKHQDIITLHGAINNNESSSAIEQIYCECCGLREECTPSYINNVKDSYSGKWVCGLCSEAVKERLTRAPKADVEEAVNSHRAICQDFNTTLLNPKLSLASAMKKIAKRSFEGRKSPTSSLMLARSTSCVPRIDRYEIMVKDLK